MRALKPTLPLAALLLAAALAGCRSPATVAGNDVPPRPAPPAPAPAPRPQPGETSRPAPAAHPEGVAVPPRAASPGSESVTAHRNEGPRAAPLPRTPDPRPTPAERRAAAYRIAERKTGKWIDTGSVVTAGGARGRAGGIGGFAGGERALADGLPAPALAAGGATGPVAAKPAAPARMARRVSGGGAGAPRAPGDREAQAGEPADAEALQAGEVDDNRLFPKYLDYAGKYAAGGGVHRFNAAERYRIRVVNAARVGVPDARLVVSGGEGNRPLFRARTMANGEAWFFPDALGVTVPGRLEVTAQRGDWVASQSVERDPKGGEWTLRLAEVPDRSAGMNLDLLFLVDTTGSMSEEISRVRDTIQSVSAQIRSLPARPNLRLGLVLYRDRGDEYVTRRLPFVTDVDAFHRALQDVRAGGGGDEPEDMNAGLQQAVEAMEWSGENAVRMMFVIADAPPHLDYKDEYDYFLGGQRAVEKGIKVIGVSTIGTNDVGEFVFRQLALLSGGRFVFVTRGAAGTTPHHVERQDYTVQRLDQLIVRLVSDELASLGKAPE